MFDSYGVKVHSMKIPQIFFLLLIYPYVFKTVWSSVRTVSIMKQKKYIEGFLNSWSYIHNFKTSFARVRYVISSC